MHMDGPISLAYLPLCARGRTLGVPTLRLRRDFQPLTEEDIPFLCDLADRVTLAVENGRLYAGQREAEAALRDSEEHRRTILQSLLQAEEAERTRIATALHDDTVQVMTASLLALDRVNPAAGSGDTDRLTTATTRARQTLEEATERTRRLMFELRPTILHDRGLEAATQVLLDQTARETGAATSLDGSAGRYHLVLEEAIYRGVQEALANVRKHAAAAHIAITYTEHDGMLVCDIDDDGRGFNPDEVRTRTDADLHIGLASVIERVRAAGGDAVIASTPGNGTHIQFAIPIDRRGVLSGREPRQRR